MSEPSTNRWRSVLWALLLVLVCSVYFRDIWSNWNTRTYADDNISMWMPARDFESQEIRGRRLPLWNPYAQAGTPWLASPIAHFVFYPFTWLDRIGNRTEGIHLFVVFHLLVAGWGMWILSRRLWLNASGRFAASAFYVICGGYVFTIMGGYVGTIGGLCWTPFLIVVLTAATECKSKARMAAGVGIAAVLMAFQMFMLVTYALTLTILPAAMAHLFLVSRGGKASTRKAIGVLVAAGVLAALWITPKLMALLYFSNFSTRDAHLSHFTHKMMGSCHPVYFLNLLFPGVMEGLRDSHVQAGRVPLFSVFVFPAAIFALCRRTVCGNLGLLIAGTFLLFLPGMYSPFYLLLSSLPVLSANTHPNLFIYPIGLGLALLIGNLAQALAVDERADPQDKTCVKRMMGRNAAMVFGIFASISLVGAVVFPIESRVTGYFLDNKDAFSAGAAFKRLAIECSSFRELTMSARQGLSMALESSHLPPLLLSAAAWAAVLLAGFSKSARVKFPAGAACLVLFLFDIYWTQPRRMELVRIEDFHVPSAAVDHLKKQTKSGEIFRLFPSGNGYDQPYFRLNRGMIDGIESVKGETVYQLRHYAEYMKHLEGAPNSIPVYAQLFGRVPYHPSRLLDQLNVRYVLSDDLTMDTRGLEQVIAGTPALYRNPSALPRAYLSAGVEEVLPEEIWEKISVSTYNPREKVYVTSPLPAAIPAPVGRRAPETEDLAVRWTHRSADKLELTVQSHEAAVLVLSEIDCPGWSVQVDGADAAILRVNHIFRAVAVGPGLHAVRWIFQPPQFRAGLWVAGLSIVGYAIALLACVLTTRRI